MISIEMLEGWLEEDKALIKLLETLIEQSNAHETALIAQDMVWEDIRRQTEALSKLTERVEAIEAKAQGKGFYPPGIVERLAKLDGQISKMADKIEDIDDRLWWYGERLDTLEDQLSTFCPQTDNKSGENVYKPEPCDHVGRPYMGEQVCVKCGERQGIDLSNYCGKYKPEVKGSWICNKCGKDWGDGRELLFFDHDKSAKAQSKDYLCAKYRNGCGGERAVKWVPYADTQEQLSTFPPEIDDKSSKNVDSTQELKPCQCNGIAHVERDNSVFAKNITPRQAHGFRVRCGKCGNQTTWWHTEAEAIAAWNTRPIEDELRRAWKTALKRAGHEASENFKAQETMQELQAKLADMQAEYESCDRDRKGAYDEIDTLKETNRQLKAENERLKEARAVRDDHIDALKSDLAAAQAKIERLKDDWEDKQKDASYWEDRFNEVATDLTAARERISNAIVELQNNYAQDGAKVAAALCRLAALGEKE